MLRSDVAYFKNGVTYFMDGRLAVFTLLCKQLSNKPHFFICFLLIKQTLDSIVLQHCYHCCAHQ